MGNLSAVPALPRMYTDLAPWWHLLSAPEEYEEEAALFARAIEAHARRELRDVLELGCGGGNNASFLKRRWAMTLVDLSDGMLERSRALNPECDHVLGDMRTIRLARDFDAVFVHDAIVYMTTEADLAAAIATAAAHLRPGGVALFCPDDTTESYVPSVEEGGNDDGARGILYRQVDHPREGTTYRTTFTYSIRQDDDVRIEEEDHVLGCFPRATWVRLIEAAGLEPVVVPYTHSTFLDDHPERSLFLGRAP